MGLLSNRIDRTQLNPGDHIFSWRLAYVYAHHGIYVGEGKVIHFTKGTGSVWDRLIGCSLLSLPTKIPCPTCSADHTRTDSVISSCLDCFLSGGDLYRFEYGVSWRFSLAKVKGATCTLASSDPAEDVLHRARSFLGNGFGAYHVFKNNCIHFAIYCKTGSIPLRLNWVG